jgi:hypothetical protein
MISTVTTSGIAQRMALSIAGGILKRLGFGAFAGPFTADELAPERTYGAFFAGSGRKFTDSLERDADLRLRADSGGF